MQSLIADHPRLVIKQQKEFGEILLGFEARNRFKIFAPDGREIGSAAEEAGGFGRMIARNFLGACRKCTLHIFDSANREIGVGQKPFTWFFHRMEVFEAGQRLGAIQRRWSWLHREFSIENAQGQEVLRIKSPLFRIWTFQILFGTPPVEVGVITKKWGGVLKEMFTDADTFGIEFADQRLPIEAKKLLLVATFLIDFTCFENNS